MFLLPFFSCALLFQTPSLPDLQCLDPGGTGKIHAFAKQPHGPVFVATERGLFLADLKAKTIDRLDLRDGAPRGEILSLRFVTPFRLRLQTPEGSYHLHPAWLFGRKLNKEKSTAWGGSPKILSVARGESRLSPNSSLLTDAKGKISLRLQGKAKGGASYRWRLEGHHLWRPLKQKRDSYILGPIPPGKHRVFLVAMDENLKFSHPFPLNLKRPLPRGLTKATLLPIVGGSTLLLFVLFLLPALGKGPKLRKRAFLGGVATTLIGLQVLAAIIPHAKGWPFVGFTMYTQTNSAYSLLYRPAIEASFVDGSHREVSPSDGGITVPYTTFRALIPLLNPGIQQVSHLHDPHPGKRSLGSPSRIEDFKDVLEQNVGRRVQHLRILAVRVRLTPKGPRPAGKLLLALAPPPPGKSSKEQER